MFRYPLFLAYDPGSYLVKGEDVRELVDVLQPGDILLRAYTNYLDGKFIPGTFTHAALYCGELREDQRAAAGADLTDAQERAHAQQTLFKPGQQMVIHAMAEGVFVEDILTFSRCDLLAVVRLPDRLQRGATGALAPRSLPSLSAQERALHARLDAGAVISREELVSCAIAEAIRCVGESYDFEFDFSNFKRLSCTELVYYCFKSVADLMGVQPEPLRVLFTTHQAIRPDAFLSSPLRRVWASDSVRSMALGFGREALQPTAELG